MNLSETQSFIINNLLNIEHYAIAKQLGLISDHSKNIDHDLLLNSIGMLDELSKIKDERARKIVITVAAILWTYRENAWDGLRDFLVLILSRIGFSPAVIMIDDNYDQHSSKFTGLNSIINEFNVTIHQLNHEIFIQNKKFLVTGFQKKVWDKLSALKLVGISAPTSAGKSFIILLKTIELILQKKGNIIYIVPTLSLVAQVSNDFNKQLNKFGLNDYRITTTYNSENLNNNKIYVLTQEKAITAFSQTDQPFTNVRVLIVDEIQNIEKVANEDDQRAKTLYDTLIEFRHTCNPDLTVISGPRVEGLKRLGIEIFDEIQADEEKAKDSPVASITYAISKSGANYYFNQYTDIIKHHNKINIENKKLIQGFGGSQYRDSFISYLSTFVNNLGPDSRNIIFSPTTKQARKTAIKLAELREPIEISEEIESLVRYIRDTVHNKYDMCETIPRGYVYHHGKTPTHVRMVVERAVRDRLIPNIVCTTTLMQGVNLPAQNVILRNPDLAIRARNGIKPKLSDYEIANLRGRAGRLLIDFIGRTFVLEENSFERSDNQIELFPEAEKELHSGYGEKYNTFKLEINQGLEDNVTANDKNKEYAFLLTYIRQTILKHAEKSMERLETVGINLESDRLKEILHAMEQLQVPKEICFKNRYWDPLDLNELYKNSEKYSIPTSISDTNIEDRLYAVLIQMDQDFPSYYNKHFKIDSKILQSVCISAKDWMKEKPMKTILSSAYFDTAEKVDECISRLQRNISYGLPMLLKPLFDIKTPENMFLRFIEIGAYKPVTRKMIELNIPRETAIYLNEKYFNDFTDQDENLDELIINRLKEIKDNIDYWRKIQIEGIV
ncbi:MAG: DEAD/DEAH box helicase [Candidatus Lokiarchaeota archaeon]|nr:DEAD/DEAH box helicase [Candidatus Lokiarchaeota archaeon]